jgi:hypothetical protein
MTVTAASAGAVALPTGAGRVFRRALAIRAVASAVFLAGFVAEAGFGLVGITEVTIVLTGVWGAVGTAALVAGVLRGRASITGDRADSAAVRGARAAVGTALAVAALGFAVVLVVGITRLGPGLGILMAIQLLTVAANALGGWQVLARLR